MVVPASLGRSIGRIRDRILSSAKGNYISRVVTPTKASSLVTEEEEAIRRFQLQKFRSVHPQAVDPVLYSKFVACLYPVSNNLGRFSLDDIHQAPVNSTELFHVYCNLPRPGVAYIEPQDFERFMRQILEWRNFVKPNSLSPTSSNYYLSEQIILAYCEAQLLRKDHVGMFWKVAQDMISSDAPISNHERRQMLHMSLYRDRQDIIDIVDGAYKKLDKSLNHYDRFREMYQNANTSVYSRSALNQLLEALDEVDIENANVLMNAALRHKDMATANEIFSSINKKNMQPNRRTFQVLLENLAYQGEFNQFCLILDSLTAEHPTLMDIKLLNTLLRSLVRLHMTEHAEKLVKVFDMGVYCPLEDHELFLKQMTIEDKETYNEYWRSYEAMEKRPDLKLYPTEDTFFVLLSAYCRSQTPFDTIVSLLFQAETVWKISITSRMYKQLFYSFTENGHTEDDLRFITGKLIASHDTIYDRSDSWMRSQLSGVELPQNVMDVLDSALNESESALDPGQGCFIKLSDELVAGVYLAFLRVLDSKPETRGLAASAKKRYDASLESARKNYRNSILSSPTLQDLNARDQFTYIKKGFIIDLLDLVS